eukprot:TRINITY_DN18031_c0_g4_i1.p1 TRINITY_DN18031_c0_g4~~TRINITY_DN18031_c0_g4_i1.p1  ORF type:complete len:100 (+),score=6.65 TRINITY_DN18031_c0_g4_i1:368-667(+)
MWNKRQEKGGFSTPNTKPIAYYTKQGQVVELVPPPCRVERDVPLSCVTPPPEQPPDSDPQMSQLSRCGAPEQHLRAPSLASPWLAPLAEQYSQQALHPP